MTRKLWPCFLLPVLISGCTAPQPVAVSPDAARRSADDQATSITGDDNSSTRHSDKERILARLELAEMAFGEDRLTTPVEDNAYLHYLSVLALDPENSAATEGINRIIEQYLSWALDVAEAGHFSRARAYLDRASAIDPDHPNIRPVLNMINEEQQKVTTRYNLNPVDLARRVTHTAEIDRIARQIESRHAFVTIRAPDDASGRWLYQQLNDRVSFRLQARFVIDTTPSVELSH